MISSTATVLQGNQENFVKFQETKVSTAPFSNKVVFYLFFFSNIYWKFSILFQSPSSIPAKTMFNMPILLQDKDPRSPVAKEPPVPEF